MTAGAGGSGRDLIIGALTAGGDGYRLHSILEARPDTREVLGVLRRIGDRCGPAIPDGGDFVHYDFTLANLLSDGTAITGWSLRYHPGAAATRRYLHLARAVTAHIDHRLAR